MTKYSSTFSDTRKTKRVLVCENIKPYVIPIKRTHQIIWHLSYGMEL